MQKAKTIHLTEQDKQAIAAIRAYYGLTSDNEAIRFALSKVWREVQRSTPSHSNKERGLYPWGWKPQGFTPRFDNTVVGSRFIVDPPLAGQKSLGDSQPQLT